MDGVDDPGDAAQNPEDGRDHHGDGRGRHLVLGVAQVVPVVEFDNFDITDPNLFLATANNAVYARNRFVTDRKDRIWAARLDIEVAAIAADYLDTALSADAATTRLRDDALVLDPSGLLAFIEKQRTKMLAYPLGRRLVQGALAAVPESQRWARLGSVATTCTLAPWPWGIMGAA